MNLLQARVITPCFHLLLLALSTYILNTLRNPSSNLFWVFWFIVFFSFLLFFATSLTDPGFIFKSSNGSKDSKHHKQSSSVASHLTGASAIKPMNPSTNTSALPNPIRVESFNGSLSGRINISISSENSFGEQFYQLSEGDVPNLNQIENSTHIIISKPILCKPEPASPVIYSQEDLESKKDNGENEVQVSNLEFSVVFCTVCHNDQPLRARHCTQCKQCVAMFDHHCSFVGTCIGERNKLLFFWFISFQLAECWIGNAIIFMSIDQVEELEEWTKRNIKYVLLSTVSVLLALLISVLWSYHVYLAFSNLTTWESMRREKIPYLANAKSSPFSKGPCKNIGVFCKPHKTITQWALPPV